MVLGEGEFDVSAGDDGIEVWVTQMGPWANMNTAFIDRENGVVVIIDPYDGKGWLDALIMEGLEPTHILLTHTHKDHTAGVKTIRKKYPDIEVWGHEESVSPSLLGRIIFRRTDFTHIWNHAPNEMAIWECGNIQLSVIHSPGHSPGHVTLHGHGVYVAGDLLFTMRSGRVDLPGSDPNAQWRSLANAKSVLRDLPAEWRLIPGHRYDWIDGTTPDWVTIEEALRHNLSLNASNIDAFDALPFNRFDDDLSA
jgi:hydroxyacylglutathione hydrolase